MKNKEKIKVLLSAVLLSGSMAFGGLTVHATEEISTTDIENYVNEIADDTEKLVSIDETNFPDPNFREIIQKCCDANKDGFLSELDINNVYELDCSYSTELSSDEGKIRSVKGLEYFTKLQKLDLNFNELQEIDLTKNPELVELDLSYNHINRLDLTNNTKIKVLNFSQNLMEEIDISILPDLEILNCSFNTLYQLDVSNNLNLKELICDWVGISSLDVSKNTELTKLQSCVNYLETLDVSHNTKLKILSCSDDHMKELDISNNPDLYELNCGNNEISSLDLTHNKALKKVSCYANKLTSLDISQNIALEDLAAWGNQLERIDLSDVPKLKILLTENNPMKKIDISNCPNLIELVNEISPHIVNNERDPYVDYIRPDDRSCSIRLDLDDILITGADSFQDVEVGGWYREAVLYAKDNAFMIGTSDVTFEPFTTLTRAQFVTVLHNIEGGLDLPKPDYVKQFIDVPENEWFTNPVLWAFNNGITSGVSKNKFGANANITREQLATLLFKYAEFKGIELYMDFSRIDEFKDKDQVSDWAMEAMIWAVSNHVINGKPVDESAYILDPSGTATRAECAQMIMNFIVNTSKANNN